MKNIGVVTCCAHLEILSLLLSVHFIFQRYSMRLAFAFVDDKLMLLSIRAVATSSSSSSLIYHLDGSVSVKN